MKCDMNVSAMGKKNQGCVIQACTCERKKKWKRKKLTRKNVIVEPPSRVPYEMSCLFSARSAAFSMGVIIRSTVKKAAKLAVYDEIMINVKNHQTDPTIRVDVA